MGMSNVNLDIPLMFISEYHMSMRKFLILLLFFCLKLHASETCILEPSNLEVRYAVSFDNAYKKQPGQMGSNIYILRCGKTKSQYFCYENLRQDSLNSVPGGHKILFDETMAWTSHPEDFSKWPTYTPSYGEYLYRNMSDGMLTIYTSSMGEKFKIFDNPKIEWNIIEDSVKTILGYDCQMAETKFRGRSWKVWFALDIPIAIGPWKFAGLPGLILQAESIGFLNIEAYKIITKGLTPIKYYDYYKKNTEIDREKFLRESSNPARYPKGTLMTPQMELE